MEYASGLLIGLAVPALPALTGIGRGRDFPAIVLIAIAFYYVLFGAMSGSTQALAQESIVATGFVLVAIAGFRVRAWVLAAAIAGHGIFDIVHHAFIDNPGVPAWWPGFCATADIVIGAALALRMTSKQQPG